MTHIFHRKKLDDVGAENLPKITANVQKRWRGSRSGLIFCRMKILTMPRKKAQNSDVERGPLHGEIDVLKFQILFCKYLCTACLLQILVSFRSVQLVPFFLTELIQKCSFSPQQIENERKIYLKYLDADKMGGKSIWNIWTRIKWEAKFQNTNFPLTLSASKYRTKWTLLNQLRKERGTS